MNIIRGRSISPVPPDEGGGGGEVPAEVPGVFVPPGLAAEVDFRALAERPNAAILLVKSSDFPGITDLTEQFTDDDLVDTLTMPDSARASAMFADGTRTFKGGVTSSALAAPLAMALLVAFYRHTLDGAEIAMFAHTGAGESAPSNITYNARINLDRQLELFCEAGAGVDREAFWDIPGGLEAATSYAAIFTRTAGGVMTCFLGGHQLTRTSRTGAATLGPGLGEVSDMEANDGSAGDLEIQDNQTSIAQLVNYVEDAHMSPADALEFSGLIPWIPPALLSETPTPAAGSVCLFTADASGPVVEGEAVTFDTVGATLPFYGEIFGLDKASVALTPPAALNLLGDMRMIIRLEYRSSGGAGENIVRHGGGGETEPPNFAYIVNLFGSTQIEYFHESGSGTNHEARFTFPSAPDAGELGELVIDRTGSGTTVAMTWNGDVMAVSSPVGGSVVGDTFVATSAPTGGTDADLTIGDSANALAIRSLDIIDMS